MRPESPDLPIIKRQIEAMVDDYEQSVAAYAEFMADYRRRNPPTQ